MSKEEKKTEQGNGMSREDGERAQVPPGISKAGLDSMRRDFTKFPGINPADAKSGFIPKMGEDC